MTDQFNLPFPIKKSEDEERTKLIQFWIDEIESYMDAEDFQRDFFESVVKQFVYVGVLSEKQFECLERVYGRITDEA